MPVDSRRLASIATVLLAAAVLILLGAVWHQLRQLNARLGRYEPVLQRLDAATRGGEPEPPIAQMEVNPDWTAVGRPDAPVTIVEFTDYECPFCREFHREAYAEILRNYVEPGRVRWISRDLPLEIHPYAAKAAEAAHCAGDHRKYWEFRHALLSSDSVLSRQMVLDAARALSLPVASLERCLDSDKYRSRVAADVAHARALEITGTPTFVIARSSDDLLTGPVITGTRPYSFFKTAIDSLLAAPAP